MSDNNVFVTSDKRINNYDLGVALEKIYKEIKDIAGSENIKLR